MTAKGFFMLLLLLSCHLVSSSKIISSVLSDEANGWFIPLDEIQPPSYLNSWAVFLSKDAGEGTADSIAQQCGLINRGKVGNLENVYHFAVEDNGNDLKSDMLAQLLQNHSLVDRVTQQLKKIHIQRWFSLPSDPLWSKQWSLYNTGSITNSAVNRDLNVVHAWVQGATGEGIRVSVVDDGVCHAHPDLKNNYDSSASFNFVEFTNDPTPPNPKKQSHGTSCAGIIAMQKDSGICGVGVAYKARIGGIRVNLSSSSDIIESSALGHRNNYVDIYSNSWGPSDSGYVVDGPGELLAKTLENGVLKGRNGLGNIYVWASGNGGNNGDSCAADGYASSMYTIAVGSANEEGYQALYDETCAGKLAVTYSFNMASYSAGTDNDIKGQVPSTVSYQQCTVSFMGSSASAPITAGVIALALSVNASLTWRDIQYLIVYTADHTKLKGASWRRNGGGLRVSHEFGFGAIDAEAMVTRSRYWVNVPERVSCFIRPKSRTGTIYDDEPITTTFKVNSRRCSIQYIEHVVVHMTLNVNIDDTSDYPGYYGEDYVDVNPFIIFFTGPRRGAITVDLGSPFGTTSHLLPQRKYDFVNDEGYNHWPFMSVQHWGENPMGYWNITIRFYASGGHVTMSNLSMTLYGTEKIPEAVKNIPNICDRSCASYHRCSNANGSKYCDKCLSLRMADSLQCVTSCPTKYCNVAGYCEECPPSNNNYAGVVAAAVLTPVAIIGIATGSVIASIFAYWKWKNREGYTKF